MLSSELVALDFVSLQIRLFRLRAFEQNSDYHNQNFALLLESLNERAFFCSQ